MQISVSQSLDPASDGSLLARPARLARRRRGADVAMTGSGLEG